MRRALDEADEAFLAAWLPDVDWRRVTFHEGIPFPLSLTRARAMVVPGPFSRRVRVLMRRWTPGEPGWRALLLHEAVHVQQAQVLARGRWLVHPFVTRYLWAALWHGTGRKHPMEAPAYAAAQAARRAR